ncbi:hypothetical protein DYBT9275_00870 [Dyadobacter sp. CECT 9275]|uniref:DUF4332 domain-containing protein n=1 Tax=Dyadobacter helix TaxID=2822344 RepID=A0A916J965_9BACT|nr:hypothetical protein [Dyadobacter sp. CECT 9275]CAG4991992.1 hypothetical protein DYBT9275_00870 [Dyadobacter sp. CECT 9275]
MALFQTSLPPQWVAIIEIAAVLILVSVAGYLLSRLVLFIKIRRIKEEITSKREELKACKELHIKLPATTVRPPAVGHVAKTVYPKPEPVDIKSDDLKVIEGIGPKIEELLNKEGIYTYTKLADTSPIRITSILKNAGPRFQIQDPSSWPTQASLARFGKWEELQELKSKLIAGKQNPYA